MLKRDCGKEDLGCETENNWAVNSVVMQLLSSEQRGGEREREKEAGEEIDYHYYQAVKIA